jgi:hypothetical protein
MKYFVVVALIIGLANCNGQNQIKDAKDSNQQRDSANNPKVSVRVNRKYDSKGNLIRFDSTYSFRYSSRGNDSSMTSLDTIFRNFKSDFPFEWKTGFENFFMTDSLARYDFLNPDYFSKRFDLNIKEIRDHFRRMDSLKNRYLHEYRKK